MNEKTYDNTNRGALFRNDDKKDERDADYRGNVNFFGVECWLDAWVNTAKTSGKKYFSLRLKPKVAPGEKAAPAKEAAADFDDDIPF